ncbi:MFS transporter small subunit [Fodinicola feengrottensis]
MKARVAIGWILVSVLLAYGVYETLLKAANLFTG